MTHKITRGFIIAFCGLLLARMNAQPTDGLIASYYFAGNARDTVGGYHGTVRGPKLGMDRFGNMNAAYCFDGEDDYITLGTSRELKRGYMSISLWLKINDYESRRKKTDWQQVIFTRTRNTAQYYEAYSMGIYLENLNKKKLGGACTSPMQEQASVFAGNVTVKLQEWYHMVYMFNTDSVYLYVNGVFQQKNYKGFFSSYLATDSVILGALTNYMPQDKDYNYSYFNGCVDDLKFYNRLLAEEEIVALYKEPDPKLVGKAQPLKLKEVLKEFWYIPVGLGVAIVIAGLVLLRLKQIRRRREEKELLKYQALQMEMAALRSQMNPHFIFNALNSIHRYILKNERDLASTYLVKFSQLIRSILDFSKIELISLKEELKTIDLYLEIESLRFTHSFAYSIHISEEVNPETVMVPALIIQPFVENAIWHGLLPKQGEKKLNISVYKRSDETILEIDDNGIGRAAAKEYGEKIKKRFSFGLEITQDRLEVLKKIYGINISYEIVDKIENSGKAEGTKVIMNIRHNPV